MFYNRNTIFVNSRNLSTGLFSFGLSKDKWGFSAITEW